MSNIAIEAMAIEIGDLPSYKMLDLSSSLCGYVYQRVQGSLKRHEIYLWRPVQDLPQGLCFNTKLTFKDPSHGSLTNSCWIPDYFWNAGISLFFTDICFFFSGILTFFVSAWWIIIVDPQQLLMVSTPFGMSGNQRKSVGKKTSICWNRKRLKLASAWSLSRYITRGQKRQNVGFPCGGNGSSFHGLFGGWDLAYRKSMAFPMGNDQMVDSEHLHVRLLEIGLFYPGNLTQPWEMAHRNRWFTVLNSMVDLSSSQTVSHNQVVCLNSYDWWLYRLYHREIKPPFSSTKHSHQISAASLSRR